MPKERYVKYQFFILLYHYDMDDVMSINYKCHRYFYYIVKLKRFTHAANLPLVAEQIVR